MARETSRLPGHPHFRELLPLLKNLGPPRAMRLRTLPPYFFRAIPWGIAQRTAGFLHLET
jgi:hypothetical protein